MPHIHEVVDHDNHFVIDAITRKIESEVSKKREMVQFDHNSERFTFEVPRYIEGHDMSRCDIIQIHYINVAADKSESNADVYEVTDLGVLAGKDDTLAFTWLISQNATKLEGTLNFTIRFMCTTRKVVEYTWSTKIYSGITIVNGLNNSPAVVEEYTDVLLAWRDKLFNTHVQSDWAQTNEKAKDYIRNKPDIETLIENSGIGIKGTGAHSSIFNHMEGEGANTASGDYSHAEGYQTHAEGKGSHAEGFDDGKGTPSIPIVPSDKCKVSHTPNINSDGSQNGNYANSYSKTDVVTIDGVSKLKVTITYGGESPSYDWVCMWKGSHSDYTAQSNYSSSITGKLGGGNHTASSNTKVYTVDGDTVTFAFRSDGSACGDGYGYYAIVEEFKETEIISGIRAVADGSHAEGVNTLALGLGSHAEGCRTIALSVQSHSEGQNTQASGDQSHAEGYGTIASGVQSHAEGYEANASGPQSHSEGYQTKATGHACHAEGDGTTASGYQSHAEGQNTVSSSYGTHAEGYGTVASASYAHAEGNDSEARASYSHAEGSNNIIHLPTDSDLYYFSSSKVDLSNTGIVGRSDCAHIEGYGNKALGIAIHVEGYQNVGISDYSHVEGMSNEINTKLKNTAIPVGQYTHVEGYFNQAHNAWASHVEGQGCVVGYMDHTFHSSDYTDEDVKKHCDSNGDLLQTWEAHAEGMFTRASGRLGAHSEGGYTISEGDSAHAEGYESRSYGGGAHAEGQYTITTGWGSHSEGYGTMAAGSQAHAEGYGNNSAAKVDSAPSMGSAIGFSSHTEGYECVTTGSQSHAEGYHTVALGNGSHAEGYGSSFFNWSAGGIQFADGCSFGPWSHVEGEYSNTYGEASHAEGIGTSAIGRGAHAEGSGGSSDAVIRASYTPKEGYAANYKKTEVVTIEGATQLNVIIRYRTSDWNNEWVCMWKGSHPDYTASSYSSSITGKLRGNALQYSQVYTVDGDTVTFAYKAVNKSIGEYGYCAIVRKVGTNYGNSAIGEGSHAEGNGSTKALAPGSHAEGYGTTASSTQAHAEGYQTTASAPQAHAEGYQTTASAPQAHAEGCGTVALATASHAEGYQTSANMYAHSEGYQTTASAPQAHAEGYQTTASAPQAHAEGEGTQAVSYNCHAEGYKTFAANGRSHAEGDSTSSTGVAAHAEGVSTSSTSEASHAEGKSAGAYGTAAHAEGVSTVSTSEASHAEGKNTGAYGTAAHAEGVGSQANNEGAHAEGIRTGARVSGSHTEGVCSEATGKGAHAEGSDGISYLPIGTKVSHTPNISDDDVQNGNYENNYTKTEAVEIEGASKLEVVIKYSGSSTTLCIWEGSHPEYTLESNWQTSITGKLGGSASWTNTVTYTIYNSAVTIGFESGDGDVGNGYGYYAIVKGSNRYGPSAKGEGSHAEGISTNSTNFGSHAEGVITTALGIGSHAEGIGSTATDEDGSIVYVGGVSTANYSHSEGQNSVAYGRSMHVEGEYNIHPEESTNPAERGDFLHVAGNGTADDARSNAYTLDWNGNAWFAGSVDATAILLRSSTPGSNKRFMITIDDTGAITATEYPAPTTPEPDPEPTIEWNGEETLPDGFTKNENTVLLPDVNSGKYYLTTASNGALANVALDQFQKQGIIEIEIESSSFGGGSGWNFGLDLRFVNDGRHVMFTEQSPMLKAIHSGIELGSLSTESVNTIKIDNSFSSDPRNVKMYLNDELVYDGNEYDAEQDNMTHSYLWLNSAEIKIKAIRYQCKASPTNSEEGA